MIPAYNEEGNVSFLAEKIITEVDNLFNYEMLIIFRHMYEACKKNSIPTDIAPKIRVSLVVLPYEGRYFREGYGFDDFIS